MWKDHNHGRLLVPKGETTFLQIRHHWGRVLAQCHGHKEVIAKDARDTNNKTMEFGRYKEIH